MNFDALESSLSAHQFLPCGATQESSIGWVPPREENGLMAEKINGQTIIKLMIETKSVPASAVREAVDLQVKRLESETGRKPGKKEKRNIADDVILSLLPNAFPKRKAVTGWLTHDGFLMLDSVSVANGDAFLSALLCAVNGLTVSLIQTVKSPQSAMTQWLLSDPVDWPSDFTVERETVLKSTGEDSATVKFSKHYLATDDVKKHVMEGKLPTQLAVSWDGRVAFVMTDCLGLKKVQILDGMENDGAEDTCRFDGDVALVTGCLRPAIDGLIDALGGETK